MKHVKPHLAKVVRKAHQPPKEDYIRMAQCEKINGLTGMVMDHLRDQLTSSDITEYQDTTELREWIATYHKVEPDNILITTGSDAALKLIFQTFVKTFAMTSEFYFPMYEVYANMNDARLVTVPYAANNTMIPHISQFNKAVDLVVLANPNSPVGDYMQKHHVAKLLDHGIPTIIDEAYVDYVEQPDDLTALLPEYDNLMLTRTISKGMGGAGLRLGYIIATKETIETLSTCADSYPVTGLAIKYAMMMLRHEHNEATRFQDLVRMMRESLEYKFQQSFTDYRTSNGNWMHVEQTDKMVDFFERNMMDVKLDCRFPNSTKRWIRFSLGYYRLLELMDEEL